MICLTGIPFSLRSPEIIVAELESRLVQFENPGVSTGKRVFDDPCDGVRGNQCRLLDEGTQHDDIGYPVVVQFPRQVVCRDFYDFEVAPGSYDLTVEFYDSIGNLIEYSYYEDFTVTDGGLNLVQAFTIR